MSRRMIQHLSNFTEPTTARSNGRTKTYMLTPKGIVALPGVASGKIGTHPMTLEKRAIIERQARGDRNKLKRNEYGTVSY